MNSYWKDKVIEDSKLYCSLTYLNSDSYQPGKIHSLLQINTDPVRETARLSVKLKLVTDTYTCILQEKRSRFQGSNQSALCCLCNEESETVEHFILQCKILEPIRQSAISEINSICLERYSESFYGLPVRAQLQFILDASKIHEERYASLATDHLNDIEYQSRRLCYLLHGVRQRTLNTVSLRKRF